MKDKEAAGPTSPAFLFLGSRPSSLRLVRFPIRIRGVSKTSLRTPLLLLVVQVPNHRKDASSAWNRLILGCNLTGVAASNSEGRFSSRFEVQENHEKFHTYLGVIDRGRFAAGRHRRCTGRPAQKRPAEGHYSGADHPEIRREGS